MEDKVAARDISALWLKAGQRSGGTYREFKSKDSQGAEARSAAAKECAVERKTAAPAAKPLPAKPLPAKPLPRANGAGVKEADRSVTPPLDRLLAGRKKQPAQAARQTMTVALFGLAGGVGKTTIAATLGRVLSGERQRVVLVNAAGRFGFEPFVHAHAHAIGSLTFIHAMGDERALPMTLVEAADQTEIESRESLRLIEEATHQAHTTLVDLPVKLGWHERQLLRTADHVLVPLEPDMHSAVTLEDTAALLRAECEPRTEIHYLLNRYDASRALHRELRAHLEAILGEDLLPVIVREEPLMPEAARSGATIVDYAPQSGAAADFAALAQWASALKARHPRKEERSA